VKSKRTDKDGRGWFVKIAVWQLDDEDIIWWRIRTWCKLFVSQNFTATRYCCGVVWLRGRCTENVDGRSRQGYLVRGWEKTCIYIKGTKHPRGYRCSNHAVAVAWLKSLAGGQRLVRWQGPIIIRHAGIRLLNDAKTISRYVLSVLQPTLGVSFVLRPTHTHQI
jgi:hypothetical protein